MKLGVERDPPLMSLFDVIKFVRYLLSLKASLFYAALLAVQ